MAMIQWKPTLNTTTEVTRTPSRRTSVRTFPSAVGADSEDKIVEVQLTRFPSEAHWPAGEIVSVIGFLDDPDVETTVIMKKYGLAAEFPEAVEAEAQAEDPANPPGVPPDPYRIPRESSLDPRKIWLQNLLVEPDSTYRLEYERARTLEDSAMVRPILPGNAVPCSYSTKSPISSPSACGP